MSKNLLAGSKTLRKFPEQRNESGIVNLRYSCLHVCNAGKWEWHILLISSFFSKAHEVGKIKCKHRILLSFPFFLPPFESLVLEIQDFLWAQLCCFWMSLMWKWMQWDWSWPVNAKLPRLHLCSRFSCLLGIPRNQVAAGISVTIRGPSWKWYHMSCLDWKIH